MDAATLIARVRARVSEHFLAQIDGVSGAELLPVMAAVFARVSERRVAAAAARLIRDATGAVRATGTVTLTFSEATGAEAQVLNAGVVLFKTRWGVRFRLTETLTRASEEGAGNEVVGVEAVYPGWDGNVRGDCVTEWAIPDLNNPNSIEWDVGVGEDGKAEFFERVRSGSIIFVASDMTGGRPGTLDLIAQGRGMPRAEGESDASLRKRLRAPPDLVTPAGILRAVNKVLGYDGATMSEYWEHAFTWGSETLGGWGLHPWGAARTAIVFVPEGSDVVALQELVNRIKAAGYHILVREQV